MLDVRWSPLAWNSACAAVARSCDVAPEFVVADGESAPMAAALWRRRATCTPRAEVLQEHLVSCCLGGGGRCTIEVDGGTLECRQQPGSLTILRAGTPVRWSMEPESSREPILHLHLYIRPGAFDADGHGAVGRSGPAFRLRHAHGLRDPWLAAFFQMLVNEVEACASRGTLAQSRFLDRAAGLLIEHLRVECSEPPRPAAGHRPPLRDVSPLRPTLLRRVEQHVAEHLAGPLPIAELARLVALSDDHFVRAFRAATGHTPHQYVLDRRLAHARLMLSEAVVPIQDVALRCGFADGAHFSATFRRLQGMTPTEYRRRH